MRLGSTTLQAQGAIARALRRPKLRQDLQISEQVVRGETSFVIKVPNLFKYARYGPLEFSVLKYADGTRTTEEIAEAVNAEAGAGTLSEGDVADFLESTEPDLWEEGAGKKNLAILEKIREERRERVNTASVLYIHFSAWNPDRMLERIMPYLRWLFTPGFVAFSVLLFIVMGVILADNWVRVRQDTIAFYTFTNKSLYDLWVFWAILFVVIGVHEFGHGLTCKYFGGEVPRMGFMLIYFGPAFFTDTSDMHVFDETSKRLWVIFAGLWIEMVMCAVSTITWALAPPGSFLADICYKTLLLTGVSGLVLNLNPLMKYDGYYALMQYLEVDNMREDAFDYLKLWLRHYVLRQDVALPVVGRRKKRIFLIYASLAALYGAFILVLVAGWLRNFMVHQLGDSWGYLATAAVLYFMTRKSIQPALAAARNRLPVWEEKLMAWKITRTQQVGIAAIVLLLLLPPLSRKTTSEFQLEPGRRADAHALTDGWIERVLVHSGDRVAPGQILAVLRNPELDAQLVQLSAQRSLAEDAMLEARRRRDPDAADVDYREFERLDGAVREARTRQGRLLLEAPGAGEITTLAVEQRVGEFLPEGGLFAGVADASVMRARILVRDWELQDIQEGAAAKLSVRAYPYRSYAGRVKQILPAAAEEEPVALPKSPERAGRRLSNYFAVVLEFENPDGSLREGMTGTAKIYGTRSPLLWQWGQGVWRWLRSVLW
ncbi:MAG TPA: efflux RND transporter periplasmic adaptor subunit [Candidatus Acidoferrales bacterium]|nr:efflux RND transporter periplasmic adaptor subunit [Candidatus Acidoferrales bacterium]